MVSKAREDLPEPERPVMTVRELRGISTLMFLRLCWRAPRTTSLVRPMIPKRSLHRSRACSRQALTHSGYTEARITFHNSRGITPGSTLARSLARAAYRKHCRHFKLRVKFDGGCQLFTWI